MKLSHLALPLLLGSACTEEPSQTPRAPIAHETRKIEAVAKDFSLGERQPLNLEVAKTLQVSHGNVKLYPSKDPANQDRIFFVVPEVHLQGDTSAKPVYQVLHKNLLENTEFLIENFQIDNLGFESAVEMQDARKLKKTQGWTDAQVMGLLVSTQAQMTSANAAYGLTQDDLRAFAEGLNETRTWKEKKARLAPYAGNMPATHAIQAQYIDCPELTLSVLDADDALDRSFFDDQIHATIQGVVNDPINNANYGAALDGNRQAAQAYCGTWSAYQTQVVEPWVRSAHTDRDALIVEKLHTLKGNALITFGTFHTMSLVAGLQELGTVLLVETDGLRDAFKDLPPETQLTDKILFTQQGARLSIAHYLPDLDFKEGKKVLHCEDLLRK